MHEVIDSVTIVAQFSRCASLTSHDGRFSLELGLCHFYPEYSHSFLVEKKCGCSMCHTVRYNACHARILVANFPIWSSITRYSGTLAERVILYIKKHCSIVCRRQSRQIVSFLCYSEKSPANIIALIGLQTNIRSHLPLFLLAATTTTTITTSFINTTYS